MPTGSKKALVANKKKKIRHDLFYIKTNTSGNKIGLSSRKHLQDEDVFHHDEVQATFVVPKVLWLLFPMPQIPASKGGCTIYLVLFLFNWFQ